MHFKFVKYFGNLLVKYLEFLRILEKKKDQKSNWIWSKNHAKTFCEFGKTNEMLQMQSEIFLVSLQKGTTVLGTLFTNTMHGL